MSFHICAGAGTCLSPERGANYDWDIDRAAQGKIRLQKIDIWGERPVRRKDLAAMTDRVQGRKGIGSWKKEISPSTKRGKEGVGKNTGMTGIYPVFWP